METKLNEACPGGVLEKNLTGGGGGSAHFFGSDIFYFLIFWVWKRLSYFFGSEDILFTFLD